jgi:hypothetical protein
MGSGPLPAARVVHRSLAEFCMLLDVPLGLALVVLALTG